MSTASRLLPRPFLVILGLDLKVILSTLFFLILVLIFEAPLILRLEHERLLWLVKVRVAVFGCCCWLDGSFVTCISDVIFLIVHVSTTAD